MDEKYIQDLYNHLGGATKFGKYEDFRDMISSDQTYRKQFHDTFGEKQLGSYQDFDNLVKKKDIGKHGSVDLEGSSLQSGNSLSQSNGEALPTVSDYGNGEIVPDDIFSKAKAYNDFNSRTKEESQPIGSSFGMGTNSSVQVPDEESKKAAKKLQESNPDTDLSQVFNEVKDIPEDILRDNKDRLQEERSKNPVLYQRDVARLKWSDGLNNAIKGAVESGYLSPDNYDNLKQSINASLENSSVGTYAQQRENVQSIANKIKEFGGDKADDILKNYATEVSKVYGNSYKNGFDKSIEGTPESKYLTPEAQLGYQYLKDISPDKAAQYERLFIDQKTLKDNPDAQKGYNHLMQTLEETGIGLQQNAITEDINNLKNIADKNGGLDEQQLTQATGLEKKQEELSQKRNELDTKYPDRIPDKVNDAVNEVMGKDINWGEYAAVKTGQALKNTGEGIWESVSTPFMSDASNKLRELSLMGESITDENNLKQPDKNKALLNDKMIIQPELQTQVDAIKNNKILTDDQKRKQLYSLFYNNTDKFGRVPIQGGQFNVNPSSILYGLTDLGTSLLPFVGLEYLTGGGATASAGRKFLSTFTSAAATSFHDEYANAIMEGKPQSEAYKSAMASTAITSFAMAGASTPTELRAMAKGNSSAEKIIQGMSDKAIQDVLDKGTPKGLSKLKQAFVDRAKATPDMVLGGLKTGAKFEAYMGAANEINGKEQNFKQSLLNIANFGIMGAGLGHVGYKSPTELQKGSIVEFGKNPDAFRSELDDMKKNGMNQSEYDHRKMIIDKSEEAYKTLPKANAKGQPLTEKEKGEYMYNTVIKNEGKKAASTLPPKQAEKAEMTAMVADHANDIILDTPTDKQLQDRKDKLEKALIPEKDADDKNIEIPEKELLNTKAELQAVNDAIENKPKVTEDNQQASNTSNEGGGVVDEGVVDKPKSILESNTDLKGNKKQPFYQTKDEYIKNEVNKSGVSKRFDYEEETAIDDHKNFVDDAIKQKTVVEAKDGYWMKDNSEDGMWHKLDEKGEFIKDSEQDNPPIGKKLTQFEYGIKSGEITANDAKEIIESAGLEVPKDILDKSLSTKPEIKNEEDQATKVSDTKTEGSNTAPPNGKSIPKAETGEEGGKEWEAIRKEKQIELEKVKAAYDKQKVKTWDETMSNGLSKVQKMYPEKNLYDAANLLMHEINLGGGHGELTPDEAVAAMHYLKMETKARRGEIGKRKDADGVPVLESQNDITRGIAALEDEALKNTYQDAALAAKQITTQAGRTLNYAQAEIMNDPESGLQIRRMALSKSKGKPLSAEDMKWTKDMFDKEMALKEQEAEIRSKAQQAEFDQKIADLEKEYEAKLKQTGNTPKGRVTKEATLNQKGDKNLADKIRKLKLTGTKVDFTFGTWNLAVEGVARLVEAGKSIKEAIQKLIDDKEVGFKTDKDRNDFEALFAEKLSKPTPEETLDKIKDFVKESGDTDVTNEMVGNNLIRDYINSHIGEVDKDKLFDEAYNSLKKELPNISKEKLIEAYLKKGDFEQHTKKQLEGGLRDAQLELKKLAKQSLTADQEQKIKLSQSIKNEENKIKKYQKKLDNKEFEEPQSSVLRKESADLIRIKKQESLVENEFRKKQREYEENKKGKLGKVPDLLRSVYVNILIGSYHTLAKVGEMGIGRPTWESLRRKTINHFIIDKMLPNLSQAALKGGEGSNWIGEAWKALKSTYSDKDLENIYDKRNKEYDIAAKAYSEYAKTDNPNPKLLKKLKTDVDKKLVEAQGVMLYKFIGGSSIKDMMTALIERSNEIEKQFGDLQTEKFKGADAIDKTKYLIGFIGRSHGMLKTPSGRFSFALGYMARLEGAVKAGETITGDKMLEIANESYLDWQRGKYQQDNAVTGITNYIKQQLANPNKSVTDKTVLKATQAINWLMAMDVPIARVPLNLLHEKLVEYGMGLIKAAYIWTKEKGSIKKEMKESGFTKENGFNEEEIKKEFAEKVKSLDPKQAATIVRCISKGGIGLATMGTTMYLLHLFIGLNFGGLQHKGQKKKKEDELLKENELNPGQIEINKQKFSPFWSDMITHNQALYPGLLGLSMAQAYNDEIDKGNKPIESIRKDIWQHVKTVEGEIPQTKWVSPSGLIEDVYKGVSNKLGAGIEEGKDLIGSNNKTDVDKFLEEKHTAISPYNEPKIHVTTMDGSKLEYTKNNKKYDEFITERERLIRDAVKQIIDNGWNDEFGHNISSDKIDAIDYSGKYGLHKKIEEAATNQAKINILGANGLHLDKIDASNLKLTEEPNYNSVSD